MINFRSHFVYLRSSPPLRREDKLRKLDLFFSTSVGFVAVGNPIIGGWGTDVCRCLFFLSTVFDNDRVSL